MNAEDAGFAIRRVVIALASACDSVRQIEAAADLADRLHAELRAVFFEDADLLQVAELPFTRQVALGRVATRPLERKTVEDEYRALANRARRCLERVALERRIAWSFDIVKSAPPSEEPLARTNELLVLETRARAFAGRIRLPIGVMTGMGAGHGARAFLAEAPTKSRRIAVFLDGSPSSARALDAAIGLAGQDLRSVDIYCLPGASDERTQQRLAKAGLRSVGVLSDGGPQALRRMLRASSAGIGVVPKSVAGQSESSLRALVDDPPCTILIVG